MMPENMGAGDRSDLIFGVAVIIVALMIGIAVALTPPSLL